MSLHPLIIIGLVLLPLHSCNESKFGGSSNTAANSTTPAEDSDPPIPSTPENENDCVEGDKVNLEWTGPIKECIVDQGKTYNFDTDTCMEMRTAEFDCSWHSVKAEMEKLSLSSKVMESDSENGAKLVSCGQSEDTNRIVVQWINPPSEGSFDCKAKVTKGTIVTGCYTFYSSNDVMPAPPKNEEEKRKQVYDCMNKL